MKASQLNWKLGCSLAAIVGVGIAVDALAYTIHYDGADCYICEEAGVMLCNENNADHHGQCNPGELATNCHVVDGQLQLDCVRGGG